MSAPLFQDGEEVIVADSLSVSFTAVIVACAFYSRSPSLDIRDGMPNPPGYYYTVDNDPEGDNPEDVEWHGTSLRKKHKPADQSFDELIASTKRCGVAA